MEERNSSGWLDSCCEWPTEAIAPIMFAGMRARQYDLAPLAFVPNMLPED